MPYSDCRPTLPSLHTLDLPMAFTGIAAHHDPYKFGEHATPTGSPVQEQWTPRLRRVSNLSFSSSRTSSPTPLFSDFSCQPSTAHPPPEISLTKFRLVPAALEVADAVIVVPSTEPLKYGAKQRKALLLVGTAVHNLRHPHRRIAKGARVHPYRIVKPSDYSRKFLSPSSSSSSSTLSTQV